MYDGLKLIGGGLLALLSSYIGLLVKRRYLSREKFYARLCDFIGYTRRELTSKMTSIPEICLAFAGENKDDFSVALRGFATGLRSGKSTSFSPSHLKDDEAREVSVFLEGLGKSSLSEQIAYLDDRGVAFKQKLSSCADESKRLGGMYFKLFVLLGVALMVVTA